MPHKWMSSQFPHGKRKVAIALLILSVLVVGGGIWGWREAVRSSCMTGYPIDFSTQSMEKVSLKLSDFIFHIPRAYLNFQAETCGFPEKLIGITVVDDGRGELGPAAVLRGSVRRSSQRITIRIEDEKNSVDAVIRRVTKIHDGCQDGPDSVCLLGEDANLWRDYSVKRNGRKYFVNCTVGKTGPWCHADFELGAHGNTTLIARYYHASADIEKTLEYMPKVEALIHSFEHGKMGSESIY